MSSDLGFFVASSQTTRVFDSLVQSMTVGYETERVSETMCLPC
jgi:hypothetical protein